MAKKVRLKEGGILRTSGYGDIHDGNVTFELYQELVASNPNYAAQFVVSDEDDKPAVKTKKTPTTTDNG